MHVNNPIRPVRPLRPTRVSDFILGRIMAFEMWLEGARSPSEARAAQAKLTFAIHVFRALCRARFESLAARKNPAFSTGIAS
jgi:hypothetical protein